MRRALKTPLILFWLLILPVPMAHPAAVQVVTHQYAPYQYEEEGERHHHRRHL